MSTSIEFILETIFPEGIQNLKDEEINGLPKGVTPINCDVLLSGEGRSKPNERRTHMLLEAGGHLFFLRICSAYQDSGYDEFVVIRQIEESDTPAGKKLKEYAQNAITSLCDKVTVNNLNVVSAEPTI